MHFINDFESGKVGMSYVYPVYLTDSKKGGSHYHHNSTGILEKTPLLLKPNWDDGEGLSALSEDGSTTWIDSENAADEGSGGIQGLKQRLQTSLDKYPEAVDCYNLYSSRSDASSAVAVTVAVAAAAAVTDNATGPVNNTFGSVFSPLEAIKQTPTIRTATFYYSMFIILIVAFYFLKFKIKNLTARTQYEEYEEVEIVENNKFDE